MTRSKSRILDQFGQEITHHAATSAPVNRAIRARYDSQFTTDENARHWAMADAMSADASANWMVRRTLRMRSRYEVANNSYAKGIVSTVANYCIGTGPRLQMLTKNKSLNQAIESWFSNWAAEISLAQKLRTMRMSRMESGEVFALLRTNPMLDNPVKLDMHLVEADQVSSPLFGMYPAQYPDQFFDGIVLDPWGNRQEYHVLRQHPGAFGAFVMLGYEFDRWPARYVLHDYRQDRPGQQRGVPETVPALPLFAQLRRFTLATLTAAETAADYAAVMQTDSPPDDGVDGAGGDGVTPFDTFDLRRGMGVVLPEGWKLGQMDAKQPTTTYNIFVDAILREISRCMDVPVMFASLDATQANMSSAYIITQPFTKRVQVDRQGYEQLLNRLLDEALTEAIRVEGLLPADLPDDLPHQWFWPSIGNHADPAKVATAQQIELSNGTTTLPREYAKHGLDWESEQENDAKSMGITVDELRALILQKRFNVPSPNGASAKPGSNSPASPEGQPDPNDDGEDDDTTESD